MQAGSRGGPVLKDLVLVGGGHSHVHLLKMWGMDPLPGVQLTLITRDVNTPYSGMIPGFVAGHYTHEECHIDLGKLARFAGVRLIHTEVCGLDTVGRRVLCKDGRPPLPYDVVSLDIGSSPQLYPGASFQDPGVTPVKPIDGFTARWEGIVAKARLWSSRRPFRLAVVGGGAGGTELVLSVQHRLLQVFAERGEDAPRLQVELFTRGPSILLKQADGAQQRFTRILSTKGIKVHLNSPVEKVKVLSPGSGAGGIGGGGGGGGEAGLEKVLVTADGKEHGFDECLWCTNAAPQSWLVDTGLQLDPAGFILVDDCLQSLSTPGVFAAGDVAHMVNHPRPKAGVFAVRQGPPLDVNLRRHLQGQTLVPFSPQSTYLSLISTGDKYAVGSKGPFSFEGAYLWTLKDWIDRKFMKMYQDLPDMSSPAEDPSPVARAAGPEAIKVLSHAVMRCGGCGSKVGSTVLSRVLQSLDVGRQPEDVLIGLDSPDDAAVVRSPGPGFVMVHTVDFFRSFVSDPFIFGKVAANHALSDCHAMNADAKTALAIAVVPYGSESKVESVLTQMMSGALEVLKESGCLLVGGHTSEGPELALGFSVNGVAKESDLMRKGGLVAGDRLVATKALGTGTILAADMRGKAKSTWVQGALRAMLLSNRQASGILHRHGAHACTDITGFGLLGHLVEMAKAANQRTASSAPGVQCVLTLDKIPALEGSLDCIQQGIFSSLQEDNFRLRHALSEESDSGMGRDPRYHLLFDPQTAGGLLASVPTDAAMAVVEELRRGGYPDACTVGEVRARARDSPDARPIVVQVSEGGSGSGSGDAGGKT